jgi:LuxR family transcriptional regulator, maltose regulon positive regulatory protein
VDIEDGAKGKRAEGSRLANHVQMSLAQGGPVHVAPQVGGHDGACTNGETGDVFAGPRLGRQAAPAALTALLDVPRAHRVWVVAAFLPGATTCDALGDPDAIGRAVERALDLAEAGKMLFPFLIQQAPELLDHQARHRAASAALISEAVDLLARAGRPAPPGELTRSGEPLTQGETRVLRYLSSNLSAREIADELYLSTNTVKTHQRHLYRKLDACTRTQAVERARALGLLGPSSAPGLPRPGSRYLRPGNR